MYNRIVLRNSYPLRKSVNNSQNSAQLFSTTLANVFLQKLPQQQVKKYKLLVCSKSLAKNERDIF